MERSSGIVLRVENVVAAAEAILQKLAAAIGGGLLVLVEQALSER